MMETELQSSVRTAALLTTESPLQPRPTTREPHHHQAFRPMSGHHPLGMSAEARQNEKSQGRASPAPVPAATLEPELVYTVWN